ncbi:hypothetical protein [Paenibacillus sedimenti]|uniref:Uncharacterized protein n=1 Tax=Paenibacillus sedimenti TaxID=2770274 RepID=A0A926KMS2_9BACL|nr:hypothetical protein [Paenibacillus sedimenti]MBD0379004.1 hypothetical protein [Paenibacillus sedimenti]
MDNSHYFDHGSNDTIPTPDEEDTTLKVSEAVGEFMDNIRKAFTINDQDER